MIICAFCRRSLSAHVDANAPVPDWARRHLEHCPGCREFFQSATALAHRLTAGTIGECRPPSPFLHARIMSAVWSQAAARSQPARASLRWAVAVGTACLFAAVGLWLRAPTPPSIVTESPFGQENPVLSVKLPSTTEVGEWARTLDTPLQNETELVLDDAKAAVQTLAQSLLPADLVAPSPENTGP